MMHDRIELGNVVILICPCCASPQDAEATEEREKFECLSCGQTWLMIVDAERFAAHALT